MTLLFVSVSEATSHHVTFHVLHSLPCFFSGMKKFADVVETTNTGCLTAQRVRNHCNKKSLSKTKDHQGGTD